MRGSHVNRRNEAKKKEFIEYNAENIKFLFPAHINDKQEIKIKKKKREERMHQI
jgi:hypothetical protein